MKKSLKVFAATAALTVGVSVSLAYAAPVQQCDSPIPDTIRCRNANSTLQALPNALDTSATAVPPLPPGSQFTHKVKFEAGTNNVQGTILKSNGTKLAPCSRSNDQTIDANFGVTRVCTLTVPELGTVYRVAIQ